MSRDIISYHAKSQDEMVHKKVYIFFSSTKGTIQLFLSRSYFSSFQNEYQNLAMCVVGLLQSAQKSVKPNAQKIK